ncbi:MAG: hypothetical protein ACFCVD_24720 [Nodosilinea sp.]
MPQPNPDRWLIKATLLLLSPIVAQPVSGAVGLAATYGLAGVLLTFLGATFWTSRRQVCKLISSTVAQQ